MRVFVTGGAGFIGSALVRHLLNNSQHQVMVFDAMTYAAVRGSLDEVKGHPRLLVVKGDIADPESVANALKAFEPEVLINLAAETHVDRSIDAPEAFLRANVIGAFNLLNQTLSWWRGRPVAEMERFRFHHVSTDEVFGSLGSVGAFNEMSPYNPRSPYAATKASSDHLVRAWGHTYGLPVLISNCSNNYGPRQFPEKLIPLLIARALFDKDLPIYGDGENVRDWLFVEDHVRALQVIFEQGFPGADYVVGGNCERSNLEVAAAVCRGLDAHAPRRNKRSHSERIIKVADRAGHDRRYAVDASYITRSLQWTPTIGFEEGIDLTVRWYLENRSWWEPLMSASADRRHGVQI